METGTETGQDAAREAWKLLFQLFRSQRREMTAMKTELQLNPAQVHLLFNLEPGQAVLDFLYTRHGVAHKAAA